MGAVTAPVLGAVGTARTLLFVPGTTPARFDKAARSAADVVILDLEDAVPEKEKSAARDAVAAWLRDGGRAAVRVNGTTTAHYDRDIAALAGLAGLLAVVVPKADSPDALSALHERLGPGVEIVPLVETAAGLLRVGELARTGGVSRLAFGHLDFAVDIDADTGDEAMLMARSALVVASRAAGLPGPVDGVTTVLDDPAAARDDARRARRLGLTGKLCIHPHQVEVVNAAMNPTEEQVAWARRVLQSGTEGAARLHGQMIDAPVIAKAQAIVSRVDEVR